MRNIINLRDALIELNDSLSLFGLESDIDRDDYRLIIPRKLFREMISCQDVGGKRIFTIEQSRFTRLEGFRFKIIDDETSLIKLIRLDDSSTVLEYDFSNLIDNKQSNE